MKCSHCRHDNPDGQNFCGKCGTRLALVCPDCGEIQPGHHRYCGDCGASLATATVPPDIAAPEAGVARRPADRLPRPRTGLDGERKQVTVLFADVKSSLELLGDSDPEEARALLDPVLEIMIEAVHHYEGTVNQIMGDGVMALFGAPVAHEAHAVRACYAALRMQEAVKRHSPGARHRHGVQVTIRVGLNSGDVVVRSIGSDLHTDYSAVGQTTHLAARMVQMATPGSILAAETTVRLAEGYIEVTALGLRPVKGLEEPIEVYAVTGTGPVRSPLEVAATRGLTPLIGRDAEIAELGRTLDRVATGHGQVVSVVGEPGVGKSRLVHELVTSDRMGEWLILKTGAASYNKATAYRPITDLLRTYFKIYDRDDLETIRDKVSRKIQALGGGLAPMWPALLALLDASVDDPEWRSLEPRRRRQQTMDAVRRLVFRESQIQPVCLIFEDLHWIDSETQTFLDSLVEDLPGSRLLLLVNFRPEYRHTWGSRTYYQQIRVDPLPPTDAEVLLRSLVGDDIELASFRRLLIDQTQGNPFFLEESVRTLAENGVLIGERGAYRLSQPVEEIRVPGTIQAVLAARIDRLPAADKHLLQCAAVVGETVPLGLLDAIADMSDRELHESLDSLRAAEFLFEASLFPQSEYAFRHGLVRRVTYDSLLRERRRMLHARIVDAIERLHSGRLGEHVERLAHHARQGELWDRAVRFLRQAGAKAFARSANREAVVWFEHALEAFQRLPENPSTLTEAIDVRLGLRNALTLLGEHERTLVHLREARVLAERAGDRPRLGRVLSFEVNCLFLLGQHRAAIECGERARAVAEELGDPALKTVTEMYGGRAYLYLGDFPRATQTFGAIVSSLTGALAHDHLGLPVLPSVFARSHLVESLAEMGRFAESARFAGEAIALAETTNHPDTLLWAYHGTGVHHLIRGEIPAAANALEKAYDVCRTHDMPTYAPRISGELGLAWALSGRSDAAVPMLQRAAEDAAARKQTTSYSQVLLLLGEVCLLAGRIDEAADAATRALDRFQRQGERGHEAWTLRLLGEIAARQAPSETTEAAARYQAGLALATELGMLPLAARCEFGLGRLYARERQTERARAALTRARTAFQQLEMSSDFTLAEAGLEGLGV